MGTRMLHHVITEGVVRLVAMHDSHFRRFEAHVVPAQVLEIAADLAEALRAHGGTSSTLAGEKA